MDEKQSNPSAILDDDAGSYNVSDDEWKRLVEFNTVISAGKLKKMLLAIDSADKIDDNTETLRSP